MTKFLAGDIIKNMNTLLLDFYVQPSIERNNPEAHATELAYLHGLPDLPENWFYEIHPRFMSNVECRQFAIVKII